MMSDVKIQKTDRQLLRILQSDGRISNQDLSTTAAMSTSACWRRMKTLEEEGVIEGYTTLVNPDACGLTFHAVLHVTLSRHVISDVQSFVDAVIQRNEVLDCFATTGSADYYLRVRCRDLDAYNNFLEGFLFKLDGVLNVNTNLVLRQLKHQIQLPI